MKKYDIDIDEIDSGVYGKSKDGFKLGDFFWIKYYGINVFLKACAANKNYVWVYELAKRKLSDKRESIILKPSQSPLLVTENNCYTKSTFACESTKGGIYVKIPKDCDLYRSAIANGHKNPATEVFAVWLEEEQKNGIIRYYWTYTAKRCKSAKKEKNENLLTS